MSLSVFFPSSPYPYISPSLLWEGLLLLVHHDNLWDTDSCRLETLGGQQQMLSQATLRLLTAFYPANQLQSESLQ